MTKKSKSRHILYKFRPYIVVVHRHRRGQPNQTNENRQTNGQRNKQRKGERGIEKQVSRDAARSDLASS